MKHATMITRRAGKSVAEEAQAAADGHAALKAEAPVRYFFSVTLAGACRRILDRYRRLPADPPMARPDRPGNCLELTSLAEEHPSCETMMLHATFQVLADYVEGERITLTGVDSRSAMSVRKEVIELYTWWKRIRPQRDVEFRHLPDLSQALLLETQPVKLSENKRLAIFNEVRRTMQRKWRDEDNQMLMRLIQIRHYLGK